MRVAVTGATGIVGQFLTRELLLHGHDIKAVVGRSQPSPQVGEVGDVIDWVNTDLLDAASCVSLLEGCDSLVHAAFEHEPGRYRGGEGADPVGFWRSNLLGTLRILEAACTTGTERTVLLSSRAVFGGRNEAEDRQQPMDDNAPRRPDTHYGALKLATETLAELYSEAGACTLRPTGIYGSVLPRERTKWWDFALRVSADSECDSDDWRAKTEVHGDDVSKAIMLLLTRPTDQVIGRHFNCSDIAVSEALVVDSLRRIRDGVSPAVSSETRSRQLPAIDPMSCGGLSALGWSPGGWPLFESMLDSLLEAARTAPP